MNINRSENTRGFLLALPTIFWLGIFFVLPLLFIFVISFMSRGQGGVAAMPLTLEHYQRTFDVFAPVLWRSVSIAGLTTFICLLIGYPLAFFISTRRNPMMQSLALFLVILPFWTNFLVRTYAWRILLGEEGTINSLLLHFGLVNEPLSLLNTQFAVLVGLVYGFFPFMVLPIYASVDRFDFKFIDAAHDLGANDWSAFWRVVFPMTLPGVLAGCALVFIPSVGAYVTPDLLGGTRGLMIGNLIARQYGGSGNMPLGSALSVVMMTVVMISLIVYVWRDTMVAGVLWMWNLGPGRILAALQTLVKSDPSAPAIEKNWLDTGAMRRNLFMRQAGKIGLYLNPVFSYFFLWAPILILVLFSFNASRSVSTFSGLTLHWYDNILNGVMGTEATFSTDKMLETVRNSMIVSSSATVISTIIGTMVALALARSNFPGKKLLDGVMFLPVVIPEITQGVSLAIFFNLLFDWWAGISGQRIFPGFHTIIIAHVAFNISYVAIVVRARLADMNPKLEEAARDLGANEWRTFWHITFPLVLPGIVAGALLAFTISLDDFVVTFFTSGVGTTTLPIFVYGLLKLSITPEINAISTIMMVVSTLLISISMVLQGRGAAGVKG